MMQSQCESQLHFCTNNANPTKHRTQESRVNGNHIKRLKYLGVNSQKEAKALSNEHKADEGQGGRRDLIPEVCLRTLLKLSEPSKHFIS